MPTTIFISLFTVTGMMIISAIIYWAEKEKRQWYAVEYWISNSVYFYLTLITNGHSPLIVALPSVLWAWRVRTINNILSSVCKNNLHRPWHIWLFAGAFIVSLIAALSGGSFLSYTLPQALVQFIIIMDVLMRGASHLEKKNISINHYLLFGTILIIVANALTYPFLRFDPSYSNIGFSIVLFTNILMAIVLPAVTIYELKQEQQEKLKDLVNHREKLLKEQDKLYALGKMTAAIAHEINNPLNIILHRAGFIKTHALRDKLEKDFLIKNLEQIEATSERIAKIVSGLKNFSKKSEKETMKVISVGQLIDETLSYSRDQILHHNILLDVGPYPSLDIECRSVELSQVILNLLNNAVDAIQEHQNPWIRISFEAGENTLKIRVTDSGTGIPLEIRNKIMEPFYSTKAEKGTGLGLSISKDIAYEHNGSLYYDEASANTTFVLELPFRQNEERIPYSM